MIIILISLDLIYKKYEYIGILLLLINLTGIIIILSLIFLSYSFKSITNISNYSLFIIPILLSYYYKDNIRTNKLEIVEYNEIIYEELYIFILITLILFYSIFSFLNKNKL